MDIDFALMGRKAVDFLYEKGHRTVVFLRNNESDYNRHSGYVVIFRESLLAHAKELGMTVIESEHYEADSFDAQHFVSTVFAHPDRPTAIINQANASVLSQVLMALHDAGMSIPQDVSVLSCGTYFEGEPTRFPITEMPVMPEELCAEAMNLLVSAIEEHTDIKGSVELIEPAMKRRGSVAEAGSGGTI